jgi:cytosine permease
MAADYILSGKKWAGPREGINWAGYGAWAAGFAVGVQKSFQPAVLYGLIVGFIVYVALAKMGLEPKPVPMPQGKTANA